MLFEDASGITTGTWPSVPESMIPSPQNLPTVLFMFVVISEIQNRWSAGSWQAPGTHSSECNPKVCTNPIHCEPLAENTGKGHTATNTHHLQTHTRIIHTYHAPYHISCQPVSMDGCCTSHIMHHVWYRPNGHMTR